MEELRENIKEGLLVAKGKVRERLTHAKVIGISCDVCKPEDVRRLASFAVDELGSVDIWVSIWNYDINYFTLVLFFPSKPGQLF